MTDAWSGDDRVFGTETQTWYTRCLQFFVNHKNFRNFLGEPLRQGHMIALRLWYTQQQDESELIPTGALSGITRRPRYLLWVPSHRFRNSDRSSGDWQFDHELATADVERAIDESQTESCRAVDLSRVRSLNDWLRREREGDFIVDGCAGGVLPRDVAAELVTSAERRRRVWPRLCIRCRREYRPDSKRKNYRRCVNCLDARYRQC
jgi:hypothetical protein